MMLQGRIPPRERTDVIAGRGEDRGRAMDGNDCTMEGSTIILLETYFESGYSINCTNLIKTLVLSTGNISSRASPNLPLSFDIVRFCGSRTGSQTRERGVVLLRQLRWVSLPGSSFSAWIQSPFRHTGNRNRCLTGKTLKYENVRARGRSLTQPAAHLQRPRLPFWKYTLGEKNRGTWQTCSNMDAV